MNLTLTAREQAEPPFTKARAKQHYVWRKELEIAHAFATTHGLSLHLSFADYEVAVLSGDDFRLLIYPHTTKSTRNQHLRVRDHGSKNKRRAQAVMALLDRAAGFNCDLSFHWPNNPLAHGWSRDLLDQSKRALVWKEAGLTPPSGGQE